MSGRTFPTIPLSQPTIGAREREYVLDCIDTTWISSVGKYVDRFEEAFADRVGVKHAITCANGTVALHLALLALKVQPGDEVIVPTLTFVACANAVVYCGARPVIVDIEPGIWCIDPGLIEARITPKTRGIIAVHLRGHPADMDAIRAVARRHGLFVVEDAAQAHGASVNGQLVGSIGEVGTFSFFGNKMITTGEGGMVTTNDDDLASFIRLAKNQGMTRERRYWHPIVGFNYRMTNIQAAIGLAQLEQFDDFLSSHEEIADWYREELHGVPGLKWQHHQPWARHAWWQFVVIVQDEFGVDRDTVLARLQERGIDARRLYYPMHQLPIYEAATKGVQYPIADFLSARGVCLPTWSGLSRDAVRYVCDELKACAARPG